MKNTTYLLLTALTITLFACQEPAEDIVDVNDSIEQQSTYQPDERALRIDQKMSAIDNNLELSIYSSLVYGKGDQPNYSYKVHAYKDSVDTNYSKIVEYSNSEITASLQSTTFYYDNGKKMASVELAEEGPEDALYFVERVTYYDEEGKAIATKERKAEYEDELEYLAFNTGKTQEISEDKALRALNQSGEFTPLFESFMEGESELFMIVGENKPDGYYSALLIQSRNGLVDRLFLNPNKYKGKELSLAFSIEHDIDGDYQLLYGASLVE